MCDTLLRAALWNSDRLSAILGDLPHFLDSKGLSVR